MLTLHVFVFATMSLLMQPLITTIGSVAAIKQTHHTKITTIAQQQPASTASGSNVTATTTATAASVVIRVPGALPLNECQQFPQKLPRARPMRFDDIEMVDVSKGHAKR